MHIAFLAGLKRSITTTTTASRNRIMVDLAMGLVKKGHEVTIFGTGDSHLPGVRFVEVIPTGLNFLSKTENPFYTETAYIVHAISELLDRQKEFDLVHNHMYPEFMPLLARDSFNIPIVTTVHAQITDELRLALEDTRDSSELVCISESAARELRLPTTVVHNGVDTSFFKFAEKNNQNYMLFIGRMSKSKLPDGSFIDPKGVGQAIKAAETANEELKIIGNVEDPDFYKKIVEPYLSSKIQMVGQVSSEQTQSRENVLKYYSQAKLFLFPIQWEEPFGLVMAESMACGTPVVAYNRGSVSEIVKDGVTGFIIDPDNEERPNKGKWIIKKQGIEGLVEAVKRIDEIDRVACRKHIEENFSIEKMVSGYEDVYKKIIYG